MIKISQLLSKFHISHFTFTIHIHIIAATSDQELERTKQRRESRVQ